MSYHPVAVPKPGKMLAVKPKFPQVAPPLCHPGLKPVRDASSPTGWRCVPR